jgi:prepilin-type N-terminal cleavage/methylation domain-containing protein
MKKGFTLIEILIVVAIIAILASVVLIGLGPTQQSGRDARRLSDLQEIQNGLELYYSKCGLYPGAGDAACTQALPGAAVKYPAGNTLATFYGAVATNIAAAGIAGLGNFPQDPTTGASYYYAPNSNGAAANGPATAYVIGAKLENVNNAAFVNYKPPAVAAVGDSASMNGCASPDYCLSI